MDRVKDQFDMEKNNRINLLTENNKLTALNDSLKTMEHGQTQRLDSLGKKEFFLVEENEKLKRLELFM